MFVLQCDQCKERTEVITERPPKFPPSWIVVILDKTDYHFCSAKCVIAFLTSTVLSDE